MLNLYVFIFIYLKELTYSLKNNRFFSCLGNTYLRNYKIYGKMNGVVCSHFLKMLKIGICEYLKISDRVDQSRIQVSKFWDKILDLELETIWNPIGLKFGLGQDFFDRS